MDEDAKVNQVRSRKSRVRTPWTRWKEDTEKKCGKCGYPSGHTAYPTVGEECHNCHKKSHFGDVCRSKKTPKQQGKQKAKSAPGGKAHGIDEWESDEAYAHLISSVTDTISAVDEDTDSWWANVEIEGARLKMQIDTGAAQSLLPFQTYKKLETNKKLIATSRKFQSYTNHPIEVKGCIILPTQYNGRTVKIQYYVVDINQRQLLSGRASKALGLIDRVNEMREIFNALDKFPEVKSTKAMLPGTCTLKIDPTVTPVVHGPRRQPQPLTEKINAKLQEMNQITKVATPTDWVNSMVVVNKSDKIPICLDQRDLNRAIRREHYPMPTVEEVVVSFPNTIVFSVLDAKSGFLQIKLDYESNLLTTFNIPRGSYRWLRLPFGVKSAPEIFQRKMDEMLEGIEGVRAVMDDILVAGKDEEHDRILKKVMKRATDYNLGFNFKKRRVKAVGHVVSEKGGSRSLLCTYMVNSLLSKLIIAI